jgi:hypothetical protein
MTNRQQPPEHEEVKPPALPGERSQHGARESQALEWTQLAVAVCLMCIYIATLWVMFLYRGDKQWDRMVYLFSGYEAVVFVAVGAIFGTRIQRASVDSAHEQSRQAREDLTAERERADNAARVEDSAAALATALQVYLRQKAASTANANGTDAQEGRQGARGRQDAAGSFSEVDPGLALLAQLADELFPPRRRG